MEEIKYMEYFLGLLNQIKVFHWGTMEYGKHKALDDLHSSMSGLVDTFIEVFIAHYKKQPIKTFKITMNAHSDITKLEKFLDVEKENIRKLHLPFKNISEIQNIIDEMLLVLNQAIYLCRLS